MEENYKSIKIVEKIPNSGVVYLYLNRPSRRNALSLDFFTEFPKALCYLDQNPNVKIIVLSGAGDHFCSGIDLNALSSVTDHSSSSDRGRFSEKFGEISSSLQDAITAIERCRKPVIASIHGSCTEAALILSPACDIRFCSKDAFFSVKEVDLAITADLGTLQRLPAIVGFGNAMELALTGRRLPGSEAKELGLVSRVFGSKEELEDAVRLFAEGIAVKSPLAVTGTKAVLLRSRDLTVDQALDYVATWNSGMLLSDDLKEAIASHIQKRKAVFAKL